MPIRIDNLGATSSTIPGTTTQITLKDGASRIIVSPPTHSPLQPKSIDTLSTTNLINSSNKNGNPVSNNNVFTFLSPQVNTIPNSNKVVSNVYTTTQNGNNNSNNIYGNNNSGNKPGTTLPSNSNNGGATSPEKTEIVIPLI